MTDQPTLSHDTLELFSELLQQVSLPVGAPEFETQAMRLISAKRELVATLAAGTP